MITVSIAMVCLAAAPQLELREQAVVHGDVVRLADLVDVADRDDAGRPGELRQMLLLDIDESPSINGSRSISKELIRLRLRLAGYSAHHVHLRGPARCEVRRVDPPSIEDRLTERLRHEYASLWKVDAAQVLVRLTGAVRAPDNDPFAEIQFQLPSNPRQGVQRIRVDLRSRLGSRLVQTAPHVAELAEPAGDVRGPAPAGGVRRVAAEQPLGRSAAARPPQASTTPLVRRQSRVDCVAGKSGLEVRMPGAVALEHGVLGQSIRLRNPDSGREFVGVVEGTGLVRVPLH